MARCTGCGNQLAANARFCSLCGKEAVPPAPPSTAMPSAAPTRHPTQYPTQQYATTQPTAVANNNRRNVALAALVAAIVGALALFLILKASGVLGAKETAMGSGAVLTAPETRPVAAPVLTAPEVKAPQVDAPILAPPASKDNPMPDDVVAYLRWLKRFEAARRSMETRGIAAYMQLPLKMTQQMMNEFDENNTGQPKPKRNEIADEIGFVVQKLNEATGKFQEYPPPNPCAPLATGYLNAMTTKTQQMSRMQGMVTTIFQSIDTTGNSNSNAQQMLPQLMEEMQSKTMSKEADAADEGASQALNALRGQYTSMPADVRDFDIKSVNTNLDPKSVMPPGIGLGL